MRFSKTRQFDSAAVPIEGGIFPPLYTPQPWTRPAEWLAMPEVAEGDNKVVMLVAIPPFGYTHVVDFRSWAASGFQIDWGDGTSEAVTGGARNSHTYDFNDPNLSPQLTTDGFKQAIITISAPNNAQFGQPCEISYMSNTSRSDYLLDVFVSTSRATGFGLQSGYHPLLERVTLRMPNFSGSFALRSAPRLRKLDTNITGGWTTFSLDGCRLLETLPPLNLSDCLNFSFSNCHNLLEADLTTSVKLTSMNNAFSNCYSLRKVRISDTSKVTNFYGAFIYCANLIEAPELNTSLGTSFFSMFKNCGALITVPEYDLANANEVRTMFQYCYALKEIKGTLDLRNVPRTDSMFQDCTSLRNPPSILGPLANCTQVNSMFSGCSSLSETPALELPVCTSLANFAYNCNTLKKIGKLTTSAALTDVSRFAYMCSSLKESPEITNTSGVTNFSYMFYWCASMLTMREYDTSAGTNFNNMLWSDTSLLEVPALDVSKATNASSYSQMLNSAVMIQSIKATGFKYSLDVSGLLLSAAALNELFTNLAEVVGQTVTITSNPGAATCDRAIATAKGWTVTG